MTFRLLCNAKVWKRYSIKKQLPTIPLSLDRKSLFDERKESTHRNKERLNLTAHTIEHAQGGGSRSRGMNLYQTQDCKSPALFIIFMSPVLFTIFPALIMSASP